MKREFLMYQNNNGIYPPPQYHYNQPPYYPQGYMPYPQPVYMPYPPQPSFVAVAVPVQENGIPIAPMYDEKNWIKKFYNWVGGFLLIHFGIAAVLSIIVLIVGIIVLMLLNQSESFGSLFKENIVFKNSLSFISVLSTALAYGTANILVFLIGCKKTSIKPKPLFKFSGFSAKLILAAIAVCLAFQTVLSFSIDKLFELINSDTTVNSSIQMTDGGLASIIAMTVYACIIAPITEELVFRGFCLKNLSRFNQRFGILASSVIFGLVHANITQFIFATVIGIVLSYITIKANSIIPAIIVHFTVNTTVTLRELITGVDMRLGTLITNIWYIATFVIGLAVFILLITKFKVRLPKQSVPQKKRGLPVFMCSVPSVIITSLYAAMVFLPLIGLTFIFLIH